MKKANMDIREKIKAAALKQWILAKKLGISEYALSRKLREELSIPEKYEMHQAIEELQQEIKRND